MKRIGLVKRLAFVAICFLSLVLFNLSASFPERNFLGFLPIQWQSEGGCRPETLPSQLSPPSEAISTFPRVVGSKDLRCESLELKPISKNFQLEFAGYPRRGREHGVRALVQRESAEVREELPVTRKGIQGAYWKQQEFELKSEEPVQLIIRDKADESAWLTVRSRMNFYGPESSLAQAVLSLQSPVVRFSIIFLLAACFMLLLKWMLKHQGLSPGKLFLLYLAIGLGIYFRKDAFFQFDELHVLERLHINSDLGFFSPHNEHFIPLFLVVYKIQNLLFGDAYSPYLIVCALLHAINGLLIVRLLSEVTPDSSLYKNVRHAIGFLFIISGFHGEILEWGMSQCILLSQLFSLLAIIYGLRHARSGEKKDFVIFFFSGLAAPLFYGRAMLLPFELLLVYLLARYQSAKSTQWPGTKRVLFGAVAFFMVSVALYLTHRHGSGSNVDQAATSPALLPILAYAIYGVSLGTILRGLGLVPIVNIHSLEPFMPWWLADDILPSVLAGLGILLSLFLLLHYRRRQIPGISKPWMFWFCGVGIMFLNLLLIAVGRYQLGYGQALSPRYHYAPLIGLALALYPILAAWLSRWSNLSLSKALLSTAGVLLFLHFASELWLNMNYIFYPKNGYHMREYVTELKDWKRVRTANLPGSESEGFQPFLYGGDPHNPVGGAPLLHPDGMYAVFSALNSRRYP